MDVIEENNAAVHLIEVDCDYTGAIAILENTLFNIQDNYRKFESRELRICHVVLVHPPHENTPHVEQEERYDEGMSAYSRPLHIHSTTHKDPSFLAPTLFFNLGVAHSRRNVPGSRPRAIIFFEKCSELILSISACCCITHFCENEWPFKTTLLDIALLNIGHTNWISGDHEKARNIYVSLLHPANATAGKTDARLTNLPLEGGNMSKFRSAILNCVAVTEFDAHESSDHIDVKGRAQKITYCLELLTAALSPWSSSEGGERKTDDHACTESSRQHATILNNIGRFHYLSGSFTSALYFHKRAHQMRRNLRGDKHLDVAATSFNIAQCYEGMGDSSNVISFYEICLSIVDSLLEPGHDDLVRILMILGDTYYRIGNQHKSTEFLAKALHHSQQSSYDGTNDLKVAIIFNKLGNAFYDLQDNEAALTFYKSGLEIERSLYTSSHLNIAITIMNIARVYQNLGSFCSSEACMVEALQIINDNTEENDEPALGTIADIYFSMATLHEAQGEYQSAIQELKLVLEIKEHLLGPFHLEISMLLNSLALLQSKAGKTQTALTSILRCLKIRKGLPDLSVRPLINAYYNAACMYATVGEKRKALNFFGIIISLEQNEFSSDERETDDVTEGINNIVVSLMHTFELHKELDQIEKGLYYLIDAAKICSEKKDIVNARLASRVFRGLGDTYYFHIKDVESAMKYYSSAVKMFGWDQYDISTNLEMQASWLCERNLRAFAAGSA